MTIKITIPLDRAGRITRGIADGRVSATVELTEEHLAELTEAERAVLGEVLASDRGQAIVPSTYGSSGRGLAPSVDDGPEGALAAIRALAADVEAGHALVKAERAAEAERKAERAAEAAAKAKAEREALATDPTSPQAADVALVVLRSRAEGRTAWLTEHLREAPVALRAAPRGKAHAVAVDGGRVLLAEGWTPGPHCRLPELDVRVQAERREREERERAALCAALEEIDPSLLPRARGGLLPEHELERALEHPLVRLAERVEGLGPQIPSRCLRGDDEVEALTELQYDVWLRCQAAVLDSAVPGVQADLVGLDADVPRVDGGEYLELGAYSPRVDIEGEPYRDAGYVVDEDGDVRIRHPGIRLSAEIGGRQVSVSYLLPAD